VFSDEITLTALFDYHVRLMESENPPTVENEQPPGVVKQAITASAIGNATEWFDYGIYAYGVSYIAESIFPGDAASATAAGAHDLRGVIRGEANWRAGVGAARRSHRSPTDIGDHHPVDGRRDLCVGLIPPYPRSGCGRRC